MCWWPNLVRLKKPDYPVWETGVSGFGGLTTRSKKRLNLKLWRSNSFWSMEKGMKDIKEPTHVLTTEFDIMEKLECPVCQNQSVRFL
jgi:hypothetical protein